MKARKTFGSLLSFSAPRTVLELTDSSVRCHMTVTAGIEDAEPQSGLRVQAFQALLSPGQGERDPRRP